MFRQMRIVVTLMVAVMALAAFGGAAEAAGTKLLANLAGSGAYSGVKATALYESKAPGDARLVVQMSNAQALVGSKVKVEINELPVAEAVVGSGGKVKMAVQGAAVPAIAPGTEIKLKMSGGVLVASGVFQ